MKKMPKQKTREPSWLDLAREAHRFVKGGAK